MKPTGFCILLFLSTLLVMGQGGYTENITLTTDREVYISGEKIWFQAVCSESAYGPDSVLSTILYIELYDQHFNGIAKAKFRIVNGISAGHLEIPDSINTGNYLLRAYTQYSRNFHPYLYSTSLIGVVNPQRPASADETAPGSDIVLVAEGGILVAGIKSRVAVRMHPAWLRKVSEMAVVNDSGLLITRIKSFKNGLCLFEFIPERSTKYTLTIKYSDGSEVRKDLPGVSNSGVVLKTEFFGTGIRAELVKPDGVMVEEDYTLKIVTLRHDQIYARNIEINQPIDIQLKVKCDLIFALLEKGNEIVDVRPVFTGNPKRQEILVNAGNDAYKPREQVNLEINIPAEFKGRALASAVLVQSKARDQEVFPWYVAYNPAFFSGSMHRLASLNDSLRIQIDALMILYSDLFKANTFRNYLNGHPSPEYLPEIRDAGISGVAVSKTTGTPLNEMMVYASVPGESNQVHMYRTGSDGKFYFTLNHLSGIHDVYVAPGASDSLNVELLINSDFHSVYSEPAGIIPFTLDSQELAFLNRVYRNSQLNRTFPWYAARVQEKILYYPLSKTDPAYSVKLEDFIEMPVMEEIFSEIVPFATVRKKNEKYYIQVFDDKLQATYDNPLILLDGIPVFDMNQIMAVSPEMVEKIDITNKITYLGNFTVNGVISIKTNTDNFAGIRLPGTSSFIEFQGISEESYPVFPEHRPGSGTERIPDFRTLLYWNPEVKGSHVSFYASDETGDYEVSIRAFDGSKYYSGTTRFTVENQ